MQCVSLLVDAATDRWFIERSHPEITAVLTAGVTPLIRPPVSVPSTPSTGSSPAAALRSPAFSRDRAHHQQGSTASVSWLFRRSRANTSGHVRESTVREVHQAIADFEQQRSQLRLSCRTFMIDLVTSRVSLNVTAAVTATQ